MSRGNKELTLNDVYEQLINTKNELKNFMEASEVRILIRIEELNNRLKAVEKENKKLKEKLEKAEQSNKKNNLIVFGLKLLTQTNLITVVCSELNRLLDINLVVSDFNDIYVLGKSEAAPIKLELISYQHKILILQNAKKLKGTNIFISHDLTEAQREENRNLRETLKRLKENTSENCYIRKQKIYISNTPYTIDEIEQLEGIERTKSDSAPPTPTITKTREVENDVFGISNQTQPKETTAKDKKEDPERSEVQQPRQPIKNKFLLEAKTRTRSNKGKEQ